VLARRPEHSQQPRCRAERVTASGWPRWR
jgi:hypothetical protein